MEQIYVVTILAESGERRAYVKGETHREALEKFMNRYPGIEDMNTVYVAPTNAADFIE